MASVYKRGGTYWVRFQWHGQEVRKSARTTVKGEARAYLADLQAQYRQLDIGGKPRTPFDTAAARYIEEHVARLKVSTIESYQQSLRILAEHFGTKYLDEITRKEIAGFEAKQLKRVSASKVNHYRAALSGIFKIAMRHDQIDRNPCRDLDPINIENTRHRFLTEKEWKILRTALPEPLRSIAEISVMRGLRIGEVLGLDWNDIDFRRDEIRLDFTKNGRPRMVPLEGAAEALKRQPGRKGPVFMSLKGERFTVPYVSQAVSKIAKGAKIPNFRFHDLRHTFASWYVQRGGDLYRLQLILGHRSPAMTQRYAHLRIDDLREVKGQNTVALRDRMN